MARLAGYGCRVRIPINHSSDGALTNFQVRINVLKGTGSNSAGNIYLQNLARNWPYDIRFTTSDGVTLIDFWRQEYDDTDGSWVLEIPSIASSGTTDIYIYWGKDGDSDASNAADTAKDGAGYEFGVEHLDTDFWSTVSGSPTATIGAPLPCPTSGTTVSNVSGKYEAWSTIVRDDAGKLYIFYAVGEIHGYDSDGFIAYRTSTDNGATWSDQVRATNNSENIDAHGAAALIFDDDGVETLLLAYFEMASDLSYKAYCIKAPISTMSFGNKIALSGTNQRATNGNPILLSNSRIAIPLYDTATWKAYVVYSDNDGDTWTEVEVATDATHQISEGCLIEIKTSGSYSGKVALYLRTEQSPYAYYRVDSTNYCASGSWGSLASTTLPSPPTGNPPYITRMPTGGLGMIYTYSHNVNMYVSEDEGGTFQLASTILDRSSTSETKNYAHGIFVGSHYYLTWCENSTSSHIYFNNIPMNFLYINDAEEYHQGPSISQPAIIEARVQFANQEGTYKYPTPFGLGRYVANYSVNCLSFIGYTTDQYCLVATTGGNRTITSGFTKDLDWSVWKIIWATNIGKLYDDGSQKGSTLTTNIPSANMPLTIGRTAYFNAGNRAYFDWIFVRKYTPNEPTWATPDLMERYTFAMVVIG